MEREYLERAKRKRSGQESYLDPFFVRPKQAPQSQADAELDPLDKAKKALEKKLDAIVQQPPA
jgi:hypothetical protein